MAKSTTKDMTVGSPIKLILGFSVPLLFGFLFQQLYNLVDTMIVGRILGVDALAAVGSTGSLNFLIIGFCMGTCSGFAIPISHKFGARDYKGMREIIANSVWLCIIFAIAMTVIVAALCRHILVWIKTPDNIMEDAYRYIFIIFLGIPAVYLYNMVSGMIRATGDSKTPLYFLILSSVMNIVLDLVFILNFQMGVAGAAYATVISQAVAGVLCLLYMMKKFELFRVSGEEWRINPFHMRMLCTMGIPMGLQYSITAIGSVILQTAVNGLGSTAVAAVTAASKVSFFTCCPFDALGTTMATFGGQNVGAKKLDRLTKGLISCSILGIVYGVLAFVVTWFCANGLVELFISKENTEVLSNARLYLTVYTAFYPLLALVNIVRFMIQGMGFSGFAVLAGVFEMVARALAGIFLVPLFGFYGAIFSSPLAWIFADIFLIPAYIYVKRKLEKQMNRSVISP